MKESERGVTNKSVEIETCNNSSGKSAELKAVGTLRLLGLRSTP